MAGVCAGVARAMALDVTLLRLAFLLLGLASGIGVVFYLVLWLLLPRDDAPGWDGGVGEVLRRNLGGLGEDLRRVPSAAGAAWSRSGEGSRWPRPLSRRWIAITLICAGLFIFLYSLGVFAWLGPARAVGLAIAAVGAAVLVNGARAGGARYESKRRG
jgi:phage shock protein PspC (stress-responsive transcriptional regulator)